MLIELTPGPNMAYLAALAVSRGRKVALAAVAGVTLGLLMLGMLAALGLQALVLASPWLYHAIRVAGFLYLLWLAWETWLPPDLQNAESEAYDGFRKGLITNLLNPKAGIFYVAVLPAFVNPSEGGVATQSAALAMIYVGVATAIHLAIVLFADVVGRGISSGSSITTIRRVLALGLVVVALWFLLKT